MASPLSLYVPLQQNALVQGAAKLIFDSFSENIGPGLDAVGNVHYARITLIPNSGDAKFPYAAILLITDFDDSMTDYLNAFWVNTNVKQAFIGLASIMEGGPKDPGSFNFAQFEDFIVKNNLNKEVPEGSGKYQAFYEAYPGVTVGDILGAFPPSK